MKTPQSHLAKLALVPVSALVLMVPLASANAGEARSASQIEEVVVSGEAMQEWKDRTTRSLNRALSQSPIERTAVPGSGIVQLTFTLGQDGRPENIELYSNSADWIAKRSATHAVGRLGDLSDVPVSDPQDATFLANVIFASDDVEHDELAATLRQSERARLALQSAEGVYIALGG